MISELLSFCSGCQLCHLSVLKKITKLHPGDSFFEVQSRTSSPDWFKILDVPLMMLFK